MDSLYRDWRVQRQLQRPIYLLGALSVQRTLPSNVFRAGCYDNLVVKLPNGEHAIVDIVKLHDYSLSHSHPRGRHKARVFLAVLELSAADADKLRTALLESARIGDAVRGASDEFGIRYTVTRVRGSWIIRMDEGLPRLTSCYVL